MFDLTKISDAVRYEGGVSRRLVLAYGAALAGLPLVTTRLAAADRKVVFESNPFSLGVASGDPDASTVVLWTKLAPDPTSPSGGMKPEMVSVVWEIAEDDAMSKVVQSGIAIASPQLGHSVHIEINGLKPARWYWYRFKAGEAVSPIGRTRTLPEAHAEPESMRFAFRFLPALRARVVHSLRPNGQGRSRLGHPFGRLYLRVSWRRQSSSKA